ncbi:MAG: TonB-dependent receptor [Acidobacteria bacterium]|nr:TonB-dependent receptor [Acidobacteriota bacterium]
MRRLVCTAFLWAIGAALPAFAQQPLAQQPVTVSAQDLKRLSIEELAELDVTSVSRRVERLSDTAAAVSVVLQDDIRRTGVTTLAEAMRLADAVDVARFDGRTWAISARGFNISTANKLLVLIDGRTVYSPLFAGTFWDVHDTIMADVDRIEVIRGPGGTIWGANAVNGVVNVITKDASSTRGSVVLVSGGTEEHVTASARYGDRLGSAGSYRVYGKYRQRDANRFASGASADDSLQLGLGGFRMDSGDQGDVSWTVQGDLYKGTEALFDRDDTDVSGGSLLGRWTRRFSARSEFRAQVYYDRTFRMVPRQFEETRDTLDIDTHHRLRLARRHDIVVGAGFRVTEGDDLGIAGFAFVPQKRTAKLFSVFAQDEVVVRPDRLFLTVGSKFERNDFTGLEVQPTVRIRWNAHRTSTVWGSVSRAVRLPTRVDTDLRIFQNNRLILSGSEAFESESAIAYEGGYRLRPHARASLDLAAFVNRYDRIRSQEFPSRLGLVIELGNTLNAKTSGVELGGAFQAAANWRVHGSYAYLHKSITMDAGSRDLSKGASEGNDPSHLFSMRSYLDLPRGVALDATFRYVARRPDPVVPAYGELDLRLGWAARPGWELSLIGQNLLHDRHPEFGAPTPLRYEFERGVFARSIWRF